MSQVDRKVILKSMRICRFCLTDQEPLTSIYEKDVRSKNLIPLPLQIMACVSIEVFQSDGMPQLICKVCRLQTSRSYKFKTHCKQSDDALKLFLATGNFKKPNLTIKEVLELDEESEDPLKLPETSSSEAPPEKGSKLNPSTAKNFENVERLQISPREDPIQEENQMGKGEIYLYQYFDKSEKVKIEELEEDLQDEENENHYHPLKLPEPSQSEDPPAKRSKSNPSSTIKKFEFVETNFTLQISRREKQIQDENQMVEGEIYQEQYIDETENVEILELEEDFQENANYEYEGGMDESVNSKEELLTNIAPDVSVYACTKCDRSFPLQQLLEIHMRNHGRERKFSCRRCNKLFFSKYDLAKHTAVHTGEKPYQCVACLKTFARSTLLQRHEKIHKIAGSYNCDKCDKRFVFKQGLKRHQETHIFKPHKCNYCTECFYTPTKLALHVTTHTGIRPWLCNYCDRTFLLRHHLISHLRGHNTNPNTHQITEKQQYNYKCSECAIQCKCKDDLIKHSTIHSVVSLKCIFCFKQFDDLTLVGEHVKSHMYGNIYPCEKCNYIFITAKHLEDHEQNQCVENLDKEKLLETIKAANESTTIFTNPENSINNDEENTQDVKSEADETKLNVSEQDGSVRRSSRPTKIKDYAKLIKDKLDSKSEHGNNAENDNLYEEESNQSKKSSKIVDDTIKLEGTKMYTSKGNEKPTPSATVVKPTETPQPNAAPTTPVPPTSAVNTDLPQEKWIKGEIMEMNIGKKIVKVQKVLMTKSEVEEMTRQGRIKIEGGAILLKTPIKKSTVDCTKLKSPIATSTPSPKIKKNIVTNKKDDSETTPKKRVSTSIENSEIKKSVKAYGTNKKS